MEWNIHSIFTTSNNVVTSAHFMRFLFLEVKGYDEITMVHFWYMVYCSYDALTNEYEINCRYL